MSDDIERIIKTGNFDSDYAFVVASKNGWKTSQKALFKYRYRPRFLRRKIGIFTPKNQSYFVTPDAHLRAAAAYV